MVWMQGEGSESSMQLAMLPWLPETQVQLMISSIVTNAPAPLQLILDIQLSLLLGVPLVAAQKLHTGC